MILKNKNTYIKVKFCNNFFLRLKGMMFIRKKVETGYLFEKCNSIHTFFMFQNIDVYMLDKNFNILYTYKNLKPWKIILPKKKVYYTLELSSNLYNLKGKVTIIE